MKAELNSPNMDLTLIAESDYDIYNLGRISEITNTKAEKWPDQSYHLTIPINDLLKAVLVK